MLDHVFTDAIGALRDALEQAMLERQAFEERFQVDVLLGDVTWETSYGLPGEGLPPRVRADLDRRGQPPCGLLLGNPCRRAEFAPTLRALDQHAFTHRHPADGIDQWYREDQRVLEVDPGLHPATEPGGDQ